MDNPYRMRHDENGEPWWVAEAERNAQARYQRDWKVKLRQHWNEYGHIIIQIGTHIALGTAVTLLTFRASILSFFSLKSFLKMTIFRLIALYLLGLWVFHHLVTMTAKYCLAAYLAKERKELQRTAPRINEMHDYNLMGILTQWHDIFSDLKNRVMITDLKKEVQWEKLQQCERSKGRPYLLKKVLYLWIPLIVMGWLLPYKGALLCRWLVIDFFWPKYFLVPFTPHLVDVVLLWGLAVHMALAIETRRFSLKTTFHQYAAHMDLLPAEEDECKLCRVEVTAEDCVSPCKCTGTLAFVHHKCLATWLETKTQEGPPSCEVCGELYRFEVTVKQKRSVLKLLSHVKGYFLEMVKTLSARDRERAMYGPVQEVIKPWFLGLVCTAVVLGILMEKQGLR